jgi:hypothetical protein
MYNNFLITVAVVLTAELPKIKHQLRFSWGVSWELRDETTERERETMQLSLSLLKSL